MAIPFLNNINLSDNELQNAKLHVTSTAPTAATGQIYFNSTDNVARYHNGTAWVDISRKISVGGTALAYSQAIDLVAGTNVGIAESSGTITISSTDQFQGTVTSVSSSTTGDALDVTVTNGTTTPDLAFTWAGNATKYVNGLGNLVTFPTIPGTYTWSIRGDTGGPTAVGSGSNQNFVGGTNVTTALSGSTLTINSTDQFVGTLTGIGAGDYIGIDTSTPAVPIVNVLGSEAATPSKLVARDSNGFGYVATPASGDSTTKIATTAFVQSSLTGLLEFKGGFNASTGAIVGGGNLTSGGTRVAIEVGDYYVVTVAGDFFGNTATPLTPGDSVIVQTAAAAGASVEGDFIVVQSDTDLATLSTVGIGNVNSNADDDDLGISVSYASGTASVGLNISGLALDTLVESPQDYFLPIFDAGSAINNKAKLSELLAFGNSVTSKAYTITDTATITYPFTLTAATQNDTIIQLVDTVTNETVYADVDRISTTQATITFATTPTNSVRVLVQKIG